MINRGCHFGKQECSKKILDIAWKKEDDEYQITFQNTFLYKVISRPFFLIWWIPLTRYLALPKTVKLWQN